MTFNTLLAIYAVVGAAYGLVALLATGFISDLLWPNRIGTEAYLLGQGWGASLIGFAVLAWGARTLADRPARLLSALGFFVYSAIGTVIWVIDLVARGSGVFSLATGALLLLFALAFGYFRFIKPQAI